MQILDLCEIFQDRIDIHVYYQLSDVNIYERMRNRISTFNYIDILSNDDCNDKWEAYIDLDLRLCNSS